MRIFRRTWPWICLESQEMWWPSSCSEGHWLPFGQWCESRILEPWIWALLALWISTAFCGSSTPISCLTIPTFIYKMVWGSSWLRFNWACLPGTAFSVTNFTAILWRKSALVQLLQRFYFKESLTLTILNGGSFANLYLESWVGSWVFGHSLYAKRCCPLVGISLVLHGTPHAWWADFPRLLPSIIHL